MEVMHMSSSSLKADRALKHQSNALQVQGHYAVGKRENL